MDGLTKKNLQCCTIERTSDGFWKIKLLELVKNQCINDYVNVCGCECTFHGWKEKAATAENAVL